MSNGKARRLIQAQQRRLESDN